MANLLVTVISIALVAATSLTGIWYGGQAFLENQAKAQANRLVSGLQQIAQSWRTYAYDNGGDYTLTDSTWTDGTATDLIPTYLSQLPKYDYVANLYPTPIKIDAVSSSINASDSNAIVIQYVNQKVCEQINFIATGQAIASSSTENQTTRYNNAKPLYCYNSFGSYGIFYRVF